MGNGVHDAKRLRELQALPLYRKIMITQTRIIEWYQHYNGAVYVSFSGGKDSTVLLDIARKCYPDIKAVFVNTGLEYPEIRKFALSFNNIEELHPRWGRAAKAHGKKPDDVITFFDTVSTYGYPIISKAVSNAIVEARRTPHGSRWQRLHGDYKKRNGQRSQFDYSKYLPLLKAPFKISDECCKIAKKGPAHVYQHKTGRHPITATLATESLIRKQAWIATGCNAFNSREPVSKPMSFWTEQDVLHYISEYNIPMAPVYGELVCEIGGYQYRADTLKDMGVNTPLRCSGCERTGCMFCAFGLHMEKGETRFQRLAKTHPAQYKFCIEGGEYIDNPDYNPGKENPEAWNPPKLWVPNKKGLGMGAVFEAVNEIYGQNFMRYK